MICSICIQSSNISFNVESYSVFVSNLVKLVNIVLSFHRFLGTLPSISCGEKTDINQNLTLSKAVSANENCGHRGSNVSFKRQTVMTLLWDDHTS